MNLPRLRHEPSKTRHEQTGGCCCSVSLTRILFRHPRYGWAFAGTPSGSICTLTLGRWGGPIAAKLILQLWSLHANFHTGATSHQTFANVRVDLFLRKELARRRPPRFSGLYGFGLFVGFLFNLFGGRRLSLQQPRAPHQLGRGLTASFPSYQVQVQYPMLTECSPCQRCPVHRCPS